MAIAIEKQQTPIFIGRSDIAFEKMRRENAGKSTQETGRKGVLGKIKAALTKQVTEKRNVAELGNNQQMINESKREAHEQLASFATAYEYGMHISGIKIETSRDSTALKELLARKVIAPLAEARLKNEEITDERVKKEFAQFVEKNRKLGISIGKKREARRQVKNTFGESENGSVARENTIVIEHLQPLQDMIAEVATGWQHELGIRALRREIRHKALDIIDNSEIILASQEAQGVGEAHFTIVDKISRRIARVLHVNEDHAETAGRAVSSAVTGVVVAKKAAQIVGNVFLPGAGTVLSAVAGFGLEYVAQKEKLGHEAAKAQEQYVAETSESIGNEIQKIQESFHQKNKVSQTFGYREFAKKVLQLETQQIIVEQSENGIEQISTEQRVREFNEIKEAIESEKGKGRINISTIEYATEKLIDTFARMDISYEYRKHGIQLLAHEKLEDGEQTANMTAEVIAFGKYLHDNGITIENEAREAKKKAFAQVAEERIQKIHHVINPKARNIAIGTAVIGGGFGFIGGTLLTHGGEQVHSLLNLNSDTAYAATHDQVAQLAQHHVNIHNHSLSHDIHLFDPPHHDINQFINNHGINIDQSLMHPVSGSEQALYISKMNGGLQISTGTSQGHEIILYAANGKKALAIQLDHNTPGRAFLLKKDYMNVYNVLNPDGTKSTVTSDALWKAYVQPNMTAFDQWNGSMADATFAGRHVLGGNVALVDYKGSGNFDVFASAHGQGQLNNNVQIETGNNGVPSVSPNKSPHKPTPTPSSTVTSIKTPGTLHKDFGNSDNIHRSSQTSLPWYEQDPQLDGIAIALGISTLGLIGLGIYAGERVLRDRILEKRAIKNREEKLNDAIITVKEFNLSSVNQTEMLELLANSILPNYKFIVSYIGAGFGNSKEYESLLSDTDKKIADVIPPIIFKAAVTEYYAQKATQSTPENSEQKTSQETSAAVDLYIFICAIETAIKKDASSNNIGKDAQLVLPTKDTSPEEILRQRNPSRIRRLINATRLLVNDYENHEPESHNLELLHMLSRREARLPVEEMPIGPGTESPEEDDELPLEFEV